MQKFLCSVSLLSAAALSALVLLGTQVFVSAQKRQDFIGGLPAQDVTAITRKLGNRKAEAVSEDPFLPEEAKKILVGLNEKQPRNNESRLRQAAGELRKLQDISTRSGKLDEAAAIRDAVLEVRAMLAGAITDPNRLPTLRGSNGQSFLFFIPCRRGGSVWGSNPYTDDSNPGAAAIHAGLVFEGHKGFLRVTILPGRPAYEGVVRNGVTSSRYAAWEGSFTVEAADPHIRAGWDALPQGAARILGDIDFLKNAPENAPKIEKLLARLEAMQDEYARAGKTDEALAVREARKPVGKKEETNAAIRL